MSNNPPHSPVKPNDEFGEEVVATLYDQLEQNLFSDMVETREFENSYRAGAIALGAFAAALSMFIIMIVMNLILHYQP